MNTRLHRLLMAILFLLPFTNATRPVSAAPDAAAPAAKDVKEKPAAHAGSITVAVLDFETKDPTNPDMGKQIGEALTAILSGEPGFTLVDRATLARTLQEQELNMTGLVDSEKATKIGKLTGARIIVTGKAFLLGQKLFLTAKLIGTETSLVEGVLVKSEGDSKIDDLVMQLAAELPKRLREKGPKLVAQDEPADPIVALKEKLAKRKLPTVAVFVVEEHRGSPSRQPIDPAVETEIKLMLKECGVTVQDIPQNDLADWAKNNDKSLVENWPQGLQGVDLVVTGKAFSEFGARIGNLVSCAARAEINIISRKDGKVVLADRTTTRGVDLSENIAGKNALEKAGRTLGIRVLQQIDATAPAADDKPH